AASATTRLNAHNTTPPDCSRVGEATWRVGTRRGAAWWNPAAHCGDVGFDDDPCSACRPRVSATGARPATPDPQRDICELATHDRAQARGPQSREAASAAAMP